MARTMMTALQAKMYENFSKILEAAQKYRETNAQSDGFSKGYGICGNIDQMFHGDTYVEMERTKDNLVRRVPSYSGKYHYPVAGTEKYDFDAEREFDNCEDFWKGAYGDNRLTQLQEIVDFIASPEWQDDFAKKVFTPAQNLGFVIGELYTDRASNTYKFSDDDKSVNPYFLDKDDERVYKHLDEFEPPRKAPALPKKTVKAYMKMAAKELAEIAKLEARRKELEKELNKHRQALRAVDAGLRTHHGVARI